MPDTPSGATVRVLVAGIGNVLRGDDGFGVAVLERLRTTLDGRPGVTLIETGIAGISLVQQLLDGYDALIIVDAMERSAPSGALFVLEPDLEHLATDQPIDLHQTDSESVLRMAAAVGSLPSKVWIVGCQARECDELGAGLSEDVRRAVPGAVARVEAMIERLQS